VRLCTLWALTLVGLAAAFGPAAVLRYYLAPYLVFVFWMDLVTYLHHTDPEVPWRRGEAWSFTRGALATVDRDYGWLAHVHHHIGTHVVHHLFPRIPHYHLREATQAIRPLLGTHYRESNESVAAAFWRAFRRCRVVPDTGAVVYYAPSPTGSGSRPSTNR
jgi:omega-3 fatty acid desaturase (delta-15 desaturase)